MFLKLNIVQCNPDFTFFIVPVEKKNYEMVKHKIWEKGKLQHSNESYQLHEMQCSTDCYKFIKP